LKNKVFLISGGTGSFGKVVARYLLDKDAKEVRIFSRDEAKQDQMRTDFDDDRLKYYIGDIRDYLSINSALPGVDYVFHAAALKQVPSCEFFPMQAVQTNIVGSDNVIRASINNHVNKIICLSTDKAVYPVNAMGVSKAMMEKVAQSYAREQAGKNTLICCVRYGNVMCSRGSVIPRFIEQLKSGRPITVTEASMTRFLMALPEAVGLVDFAFSQGKQGDIFVKKAPACTVGDLVEALQNIFNIRAETKIIGIRHGEKLYETLASTEELANADDLGDYYRISMDCRDLNYEKYFTDGNPDEAQFENYNSHNTRRLTVAEVEAILQSLPEVREELDAMPNVNG